MKKELTVFLDLDGVLVNWTKGLADLAGLDYEDPKLRNEVLTKYHYFDECLGEKKLKQLQNDRGHKFWFELEFLPWAKKLVKELSVHNLAFLTSAGTFPSGAKGKMLWQQKHFPDIPIIICRRKHWVAAPDKYLVDDDEKQTTGFEEAGGRAWLWPNQFTLLNKPTRVAKEIKSLLADIKEYNAKR